MNKRFIDLSDIKENDLEKTSSFTDLMSRSERKRRNIEKQENNINTISNDIEDMVEERKRSTKDLTIDLEKINKKEKEEKLENTQILELTRQMKFNFEETKKENSNNKKNGVTLLNIIGITNLLCIGYYIYLLTFTNYQDSTSNYLITGSLIVLLVLIFGLSVVTTKGTSKFFKILNILAILSFIVFNVYTTLN